MSVPAIIRIVAQKDDSVDRVIQETRASVASVSNTQGQTGFDPFGFKGFDELAERSMSKLREFQAQAKLGGQLSMFTGESVATGRQVVQNVENWGRANKELLNQIPALKSQYSEVLAESKKALSAAKELQSQMLSVGKSASVGLIAIGAGLASIALGAVQVAARFEQLQGKLETFKGSAAAAGESLNFAKKFAATSPFDVEQIVSATATLESYKQKSETVLPRVAALAAGVSKDIGDTSLVVAKALTGSTEGFESLRNEYGITTVELEKNGAAVKDHSELLLKGEANALKAREALLKIIDTRFGNAIERQANTFNGALSNVGDSVKNAAADIGSTLLPLGTKLLRLTSGVIDFANGAIPSSLKTIAAGAIVVAGGTAVLAGAAGLLTVALVAVNTQLGGMVAGLAVNAAGAGILTGAFTATTFVLNGVAGAAGLARTAMTALATTPVGLALTAAAATAAIFSLAIAQMEERARRAGETLDQESKRATGIASRLKEAVNLLNSAGQSKGVTFSIGGDFRGNIAEIEKSFKSLTGEEIVKAFEKSGLSVKELKDQLADIPGASQKVREQLVPLQSVLDAIGDGNLSSSKVIELTKQVEALDPTLVQNGAINIDALRLKIEGMRLELNRLGETKSILSGVLSAIDSFAGPLDKVKERAAAAKDFLSFSKEINSTKSLSAALAEVSQQIKLAKDTPGLGGTKEQLAGKLLDPNSTQAQKDAIKTLLELYKTEEELNSKQAENTKKAEDAKTKAREQTFARSKALRDATLQQELAFVQQELSLVKVGSDEEIKLLEQSKNLRKQIRDKEQQDALKNLADTVSRTKAAYEETKTQPGSNALTNTQGLDVVLSKLESWKAANASILQQVPAVAQEYDKVFRGVKLDQLREAAKIPAENLQILRTQIAAFTSEAITSTQKREAAERGVVLIQGAIRSGLVSQKDAANDIIALSKQRLQAEQAITRELTQQKQELQSLDTQNLDSEIQILEERKSAGENVETALKKAREDRLRASLEAIELEKAAAIEAGKTVEQAEAVASRKRDGLQKQELLKRLQEQKRANGETQTTQDKNGNAAQSGGGFSLPTFSLPSFSLDQARKRVQSTEDIRADFNRSDAKVKADIDKQRTQVPAATASPTTTNSLVVNVNGVPTTITPAERDKLINELLSRIPQYLRSANLTRGNQRSGGL